MHFLDKGTRGKVLGLRVRCSNDGCGWEGELGDRERHLSEKCQYVKEACPHGCGQVYPRHLLQTHQLDQCPQRPLHISGTARCYYVGMRWKKHGCQYFGQV